VTFATPWALWALLAVPVVVILHLFRRRLRHRMVAGLFLFAGVDPVPPEGRRRDRLRATWPLVLECLAAALAALWLAGPILGAGGVGVHLVVVLDGSASMAAPGAAATPDPGAANPSTALGPAASSRDHAVAAIRRAAAELGSGGRLTVIAASAQPQVALGPEAPVALLSEVLDAYDPVEISADLSAAAALGERLGGLDARYLLLTDARVGEGFAERWEVVACGAPSTNVALADAQRVRADGADVVHVALQAFGEVSGRRAVAVFDGANEVGRGELAVTPGRLSTATLDLRGAAPDRALSVELDDPGGLRADDRALLWPEPARSVRVAWHGSETGAALARFEQLVEASSGVTAAPPSSAADLVVGDGAVVEGVAGQPGTAVAGAAPLTRWTVAPTPGPVAALRGPFLVDRSHPLVDGLPLEGVLWPCGEEPPAGRPLISEGDRTLLAIQEAGETVHVRTNLALGGSTVRDSAAWPALWLNLVEATRERLPGVVRANVRCGESMVWRPAADARGAAFELTDPRGRVLPAAGLRTLSWPAATPGLHELRRDGELVGHFAVRFHAPGESDLVHRGAGVRPAVAASPPDPDAQASAVRHGRTERLILALLLVLVVVADWWALGRGR